MKRKLLISFGLILVLAVTATIVYAAGKDDLAKVRAATEKFRKIEAVRRLNIAWFPA